MPAFLQRRLEVAAEMTVTMMTMTSSIVGGMVYRLMRWHAQGDAQVAKDTNARVINAPGSAL
jgi:hypothetical protein